RELVFANPAERQWLEQLTHPAIRELTDLRCETATGRYVIVAIPLLVETEGAARFDRVLVVDCEPQLQLARLQARDGVTRAQAERMLAAQVTREQRLAVADDVIHNDGDIGVLRDQVEKLHRQYSAAASSQADRVGT
ncbi:MAG TPA: dephospho-CoA kinase, partial [Steroidobacteraceae bacterium]|nr:dephospho-CoA kinase [Steroidobacteraceae bacterium]